MARCIWAKLKIIYFLRKCFLLGFVEKVRFLHSRVHSDGEQKAGDTMLQVTMQSNSQIGSRSLPSIFIYTYVGTVWQKVYCGLLIVFFT